MAAGGSLVLHLPSGPTGVVGRKLHPTVLFNICDSYIRRNEQQERVIGILPGLVSSDGTVGIRNSHAVPRDESSEQVAVDVNYHLNTFDLHQRFSVKEVVAGWCSTGTGVSGSDALIQDVHGRY